MLKKFGTILLILLMVLALAALPLVAGCAEEKEELVLPKVISYTTYGPGTGTYTVAVPQADIIKRYAHMGVTIETSWGAIPQATLLATGNVELAMGDSYSVLMGYTGGDMFAEMGNQPFRLILTAFEITLGFTAPADSGIKSVLDLKGKKVHVGIKGSAALSIHKVVLGAYGMTFADLEEELYAATTDVIVRDMKEGRAHASFTMGLDSPRHEAYDQEVGSYIIPISHEPAIRDYILERAPGIHTIIYKAGLPGAKVDTPTYGIYQSMYTREDVSADIIYAVVKALIENYEKLAKVHPDCAAMTLERALTDPVIPYHDGAIRYYKEIDAWTAELEAKQQELLALGE